VSGDNSSPASEKRLVELTRVQPIEAEVLTARLRSEGIAATLGPDSVYESVTFSEGVAVFVPTDQLSQALTILNDQS
jgi:hypothetical protein